MVEYQKMHTEEDGGKKLNLKLQKSLAPILMVFILMTTLFIYPGKILVAAETNIELNAESAILVDADTGKILYAKNADMALPPASMTKIMTEYLVWEAIEAGDISWEGTTQISDYAYSISANTSFSGIGLRKDVDYTVRSLYEAMAINSDNATTIALAELIAGSEGEFVKMMNAKAEEMNLPEFQFVNSTGLENSSLGDDYPEGTDPNGINLLSAESTALLAYQLINDYPEALEISSIPETEFDGKEIRNWNWMLEHEASFLQPFYYEGMEGLKTGYTDEAGYCFTGAATRDGKRLISVVMKTNDESERFVETAKLLDYGFENFETKELFPAGFENPEDSVVPVAKGKEKNVTLALEAGFTAPILNEEEELYKVVYHIDSDKLNKDGELTAPVKQGEKVGTAELVYEGENDHGFLHNAGTSTVDLVTTSEIEKKNWFMIALESIGSFFAGLFTTIVDTVKGWF